MSVVNGRGCACPSQGAIDGRYGYLGNSGEVLGDRYQMNDESAIVVSRCFSPVKIPLSLLFFSDAVSSLSSD